VTHMLFFKGHDTTPHGAVRDALIQAADVLMEYPSLLVELKDIQQMGPFSDAHIRVMAIQESTASAGTVQNTKKGAPQHDFDPKNPEHALSDNPDAHRPGWMGSGAPEAAFRFCNAAHAGELPDIPLQEIWLPAYELARASGPELVHIIETIEDEHRRHTDPNHPHYFHHDHFKPEPE
jgi:hypothetical protein